MNSLKYCVKVPLLHPDPRRRVLSLSSHGAIRILTPACFLGELRQQR
jgi:hypothetical protein